MKKNNRKKKLTISIVVLGVVLLSGYYFMKPKKTDEPTVKLREYPVTKGNITAGVDGAGVIKLEAINHNFNHSVTIGELLVKEGQRIKAGDPIAKISVEAIDEKIKELTASLERANATLQQAKNSKVISQLNQEKTWNSTTNSSKEQYETQKSELTKNVTKSRNTLQEIKDKLTAIEKKIAEVSKEDEEYDLIISTLEQEKQGILEEKKVAEEQVATNEEQLTDLEERRKKELAKEKEEKEADQKINETTNQDLDQSIHLAQIEVDSIKEEIESVKKLKEEDTLVAKVDGIVMNLGYQVGGVTNTDTPVAIIGDSNSILVEMAISQTDIIKIKVDQEVQLETSTYQDHKFMGTVKEVNLKPSQDGGTTSYSVIISMDAEDYEILEGMTVNGIFIIKQVSDVVMLSNKAITLKDGKQIVQVKNEDGSLREVEIITGFSDGKYSEIISGLSDGDTVVIGG